MADVTYQPIPRGNNYGSLQLSLQVQAIGSLTPQGNTVVLAQTNFMLDETNSDNSISRPPQFQTFRLRLPVQPASPGKPLRVTLSLVTSGPVLQIDAKMATVSYELLKA